MGGPETYLRTGQVADALGVSVSTIKRWADSGAIEATRTVGKHRLVALSSALRFAREERFPVGKLLSISGGIPLAEIGDGTVEILAEALKDGRSREARELIASAYRADRGAVALADRLIRPVMERVGHGWMLGSWDVYQEHHATLTVASALTGLIDGISRKSEGSKPLALGAAPEGDPYVLPGLLGELVLREIGWEVKNLSCNLPLRSLASATGDHRPVLVFLSVSHIADRGGFIGDYSYFYEAASRAGTAIIVGGRGLDTDLRSRLVYASFGERMAHLAEFARRIMPATGAAPGSTSNPTDTST
jgi:excisionase family DNA binding protein